MALSTISSRDISYWLDELVPHGFGTQEGRNITRVRADEIMKGIDYYFARIQAPSPDVIARLDKARATYKQKDYTKLADELLMFQVDCLVIKRKPL